MRFIYLIVFATIVGLCSCSDKTSIKTELVFPKTEQTAKPWTRWWWHGSSVTKEGIRAELEALQKAGIGGVELTPIYGMKGDEANFIDFLSPKWVQMFEYTLQEANRLGLGVDMATGTGWPFGGPWIDAELACKNIQYKTYQIKKGERLSEKILFKQEPILRTVRPISLTIDDIAEPISGNSNLQHLALDQVRFEKNLPLQTLMAYSVNGEILDLTDKVSSDGTLNWTAIEGNWTLYAVFQGWHGKMVERAAPGGEGNVIDHFANEPIEAYLKRFETAFEGKEIGTLRAFFNDSYEVDDARGQANWTPNLFEEFQKRRGYDLRKHLPDLFGENSAKKQRVQADYRETISELLLDMFTNSWSKWAKEQQAIIRNQAHGSPSNILDLYAASDIPETEGIDIIKIKMASSAAHVAGKSLVSAEAATWLGEHFTTNLSDLKENIDRYLAGGINHVFYHGTCYSSPDASWPGRLFYAAIHANPRNPLWNDYPALNAYITRTQSFLQTGRSDNDVLLYFPAHDRFARESEEMLEHFDGWAMPRNGDTTHVRRTAVWLQDNGFGFDFVSDKQLLNLTIENGKLNSNNTNYKVILIPETEFMPISTLKKLAELKAKGATLIFQKLPKSVNGFYDLKNRQQTFLKVLSNIKKTNIIIENNLAKALKEGKVEPETMVKNGLEFTRRCDDNGKIYFISNWSEDNFKGWITLSESSESVAIFDGMSGRKGLARTKIENGKTCVYLQINRGDAIVLKTSDAELTGEKWVYLNTQNESILLDGTWKLDFVKGGPDLPKTQTLSQLIRWTDLDGEIFKKFSGTAVYSTEFEISSRIGAGYLLTLGEVAESATISVNDNVIGTTIGPVYEIFIPMSAIQKTNKLKVAVSNSMANRIIDLEKSGERWQQFYNINISARLRENLGDDYVFTTKDWSPVPSGMSGEVTLTLIK